MTTAITADKKDGSLYSLSLSPFRFSGCPPPPPSQVATVVSCEPDVRHLLLAAAAVGPSDGVHFLSKGTAAAAVSASASAGGDVDEDDERIVIEDVDDDDGAEIQSKASIR